MSKARDLSNFISDATVDASEIADLAVTHAKLHTDMNLSSKTLTFAANQISGNAIDGGVISNFTSTGIDDNSSATAVTILSGGNVGIGTASPEKKLHVHSGVSSDIVRFANDSGSFTLGKTAGLGSLDMASDANFRIRHGSTISTTFKSDGNVGIGTSSPGVKLHVDGAGSQPELRVSQNSTYFTDYGVNHIDVNGPNDLRFLMGGSEKVRIKSGGDMSIGSDHSGFSGWRVLNMRQLSTGALINFEEDDGTRASTLAAWGSGLRYQTHIAGGYHKFETDASTNAFQINDNGHVVVNKHQFGSNPTGSKLNVFGDGEVIRLDGTGNTSRTLRFRNVSTSNPGVIIADGSLEITNEDANTSIALLSERDITIKTTKSNGTAGHVKFYSYNTEIMRIDGANNRVGIGTTSPSAILHVEDDGTGGNSGHMKLGHTRTRTFYAGISSSENRWYKVLNYSSGNMFTGKIQIYATRDGGFNQTGAHKEYRASLGGYSNSIYGPLSLSGDGGEGGVASLEVGTNAGLYLRVNSSIYGGTVYVTFSGQGSMSWAYSNSSYSTSLP